MLERKQTRADEFHCSEKSAWFWDGMLSVELRRNNENLSESCIKKCFFFTLIYKTKILRLMKQDRNELNIEEILCLRVCAILQKKNTRQRQIYRVRIDEVGGKASLTEEKLRRKS